MKRMFLFVILFSLVASALAQDVECDESGDYACIREETGQLEVNWTKHPWNPCQDFTLWVFFQREDPWLVKRWWPGDSGQLVLSEESEACLWVFPDLDSALGEPMEVGIEYAPYGWPLTDPHMGIGLIPIPPPPPPEPKNPKRSGGGRSGGGSVGGGSNPSPGNGNGGNGGGNGENDREPSGGPSCTSSIRSSSGETQLIAQSGWMIDMAKSTVVEWVENPWRVCGTVSPSSSGSGLETCGPQRPDLLDVSSIPSITSVWWDFIPPKRIGDTTRVYLGGSGSPGVYEYHATGDLPDRRTRVKFDVDLVVTCK